MFKGFNLSLHTALLLLMSALLGGLLTFFAFELLFSPKPIQIPDDSKTGDESARFGPSPYGGEADA